MTTTRLKEKLSSLVTTQLPEHITSEYPTFKLFLEKYYEFIEQDQGAQEVLQNARSYADIDRTIDSFLDNFVEQYAKGFPKKLLADKSMLVKYAKELYNKKGTEDAFRILFRLLFNEEIDFFYPNQVILKPSDGKWVKPYVIRVDEVTGSPFNLADTLITGNVSKATAIVESVLSFASGSDVIYEIYLNSDSITGEFLAGENIVGIKLNNVITGDNTITVANIYPIVSKIDIIDGGLGYTLDQPISIIGANGVGASGIVTSVTDAGSIREITMTNYGYGYDTTPNVTIGAPTSTISGIYRITSNVASFRLANNHSLVVGSNVNVNFTDNTQSDLNSTTKTLTIDSIPNLKSFVVSNISHFRTGTITSSNVNTSGNVVVTYTTNKFLSGRFVLSDNLVRAALPIKHGLLVGDNVNVIFNKTDVNSYNGQFTVRNNSNVLVGFTEAHGFAVNDSINVTFVSNYTNTTSGSYVIKTYPDSVLGNTANLYFNTFPHSFITGQNVNVKFGLTLTNSITGSFTTTGTLRSAAFLQPHNFKVNDIINVTFTDAILTDKDFIKTNILPGNANISYNSNIVLGNDTFFNANLYVGNVITVGSEPEKNYTIANISSNTLIYLTTNVTSNVTFGNVYLVTSNLNGNSTVTSVVLIPNSKRIFFNIADKPDSSGRITVSSNLTNSLVNVEITTVVTSNGYPTYNYLDIALPSNFSNANARGLVTISNQDVSNIIGNTTSKVLVKSVPNSKTLIFNSNIASNIFYSNGTAIVNTDLPGDIEDFANTFVVSSVPNSRTIEFQSANSKTSGNVTVYYSKTANLNANIGAIGIGKGEWLDDAGKLDETFKIQGRVGTDDRVFYQPFSYVIKSTQPLSAWRDAVKKLLHPAGFEVFGEVVIDTTLNDVQNVTARARFFPVKIFGPVDASSTTVLADTLEYTSDNLT